jgi:hypothetical protein
MLTPPPNWVCPRPLRDATLEAMRAWSREHPHRKKPADLTPDEEARGYAWAMHNVPVESIPLVADRVLARSAGHWPRLKQVRDEVSAFLGRNAQRLGMQVVGPHSAAPDPVASAQHQQALAMLRGMGQDGPEVSLVSRMRCITAATEAVMARLRRRVADGELPCVRIEDFRNGTWPTHGQLERIVRGIALAGEVAVSASAKAMLQEIEDAEHGVEAVAV